MGNREIKKNYPIIHIIGLPGAGKTTLGRKLSKKLGLPIYRIGEYRMRFPKTLIGEADAWVFYTRIMKKKKEEQGGEWLFSDSYRDKREFVKKNV